MSGTKHSPTRGPLTVFRGNANGRGLIRLVEVDAEGEGAGEVIATAVNTNQRFVDLVEVMERFNTHDEPRGGARLGRRHAPRLHDPQRDPHGGQARGRDRRRPRGAQESGCVVNACDDVIAIDFDGDHTTTLADVIADNPDLTEDEISRLRALRPGEGIAIGHVRLTRC